MSEFLKQKEASREKERDRKEAMKLGTRANIETQQPIDPKTGYSNPVYDKFYGKENNPHTGTERDNKNRGKTKIFV